MENKQILLRELEMRAQYARNNMIPHMEAISSLKERIRRFKKNYNYINSVNKRILAKWREATKEKMKAEYLVFIRINDAQMDELLHLMEADKSFLNREIELYEQYRQMLIQTQREIDAINLEK